MEYQGRTTGVFSASRTKPRRYVPIAFFTAGLLLVAAGLVETIVT